MDDMDKRLAAKEKLTPKQGEGYNLVGVDAYETDPADELYLIKHFEDAAAAQAALEAKQKADPEGTFYVYGPPAKESKGPPLVVLKDAAAMTPEQIAALVKTLNAGAKRG